MLLSYNNSFAQEVYDLGINVTPKPLELVRETGNFTLSPNTKFTINNSSLKKVVNYFLNKIDNSTGYTISMSNRREAGQCINLNIVHDIRVNDEGYLLDVTPKEVTIRAKTPQGIFYGMETLMQLLPAEIESSTLVARTEWSIPCVKIKDEPRFKWRGQHLDVCRHFLSVDYIKKQLDVLAMYKINKFHWHLTDDQGWRIESKRYPKLNEIGSKRTDDAGVTYGPYYYTQDQIKDIVAYAKDRFIDVIPEIELPGHGVAALAAYPQYSCSGKPAQVRSLWGISNDVYCAGNDSTFQFLTNIIEEVMPLFDSDYFHIGGDECPKAAWKTCPKCQARIKELGIKDEKDHSAEEQLQSYFVQRIEKVLLKHHKKMIGWDEILEGGLAPSATVMSWRGEKGGLEAANLGHDVIMTPGEWLYLDKYQGDPKISPVAIGGNLLLEKVYDYEPIPKGLNKDEQKHILGAQVNLWTEYMPTPEITEMRTYPRIIALAELAWTAKANKNYKDFEHRLDNQLVRLDEHRINYYIPQPEQDTPSCNFVAFTDVARLTFKTTQPVKMIVYTLDGSEPTAKSSVYTQTLVFNKSTTLKIRSVLVSGRMSKVRTIAIEKEAFSPSIDKPLDTKLEAKYYKGVVVNASDLDQKEAEEVEFIAAPQNAKHRIMGYRELTPDDNWNTVITGYIHIPKDGIYYFSTNDESFSIDGKELISNKGVIKRYSTNDKSIALQAGYHPIKLVRVCNIIGGWPPVWDTMHVSIRESNAPAFKIMDASYYK